MGDNELYLIGSLIEKFKEDKLPSQREVLQVFFHHQKILHLSLRESILKTCNALLTQYEKMEKSAMEPKSIKKKVEGLFNEYRKMQKNKSKPTYATKVDVFKQFLDKPFEIDRKKLNGGSKIKTASNLKIDENISNDLGVRPAKKECEEILSLFNEQDVGFGSSEDEWEPSKKVFKSSKIEVKETLSSALDPCGVSHRKAHLIVSQSSENLGKPFGVSSTTLWRKRKENREKLAAQIKEEFIADDFLTVHWDGKALPNCTDDGNGEKVERLAVLVSGGGKSKILGVPKLPSSTGASQASAVHEYLKKWELEEKVVGMCFDTTSSNTGKNQGACVLLEKILKKKLLYFACRYHMFEIIAKTAFEKLFKDTQSPNIALFEKFRAAWNGIEKSEFTTAASDKKYIKVFGDQTEFINFCCSRISQGLPRDDYKEFLELCIIFLGHTPPSGISFKKPGAIHKARWMNKVIYSLKIYLFKRQFRLSSEEIKSLKKFCEFIIIAYARAWFTAPLAIKAPYNDLRMLKTLCNRKDEPMWQAAAEKLAKHSWYLRPELVGMAFFDNEVSVHTKRQMLKALDQSSEVNNLNIALESVKYLELENFVNINTKTLFDSFDINTSFFNEDPSNWDTNNDYLQGKAKLKSIAVTNDNSERAIALMSEFNNKITKSEEQKQCLLQVVEFNRQQAPFC